MSDTKGFQVPKQVMFASLLPLFFIFNNFPKHLPEFLFSCVCYLGLVLCSIYNSPEL